MNDRVKYLSVNEEQYNRIQHIRDVYNEIEETCKSSRETFLEEAQFWAIKGITREEV